MSFTYHRVVDELSGPEGDLYRFDGVDMEMKVRHPDHPDTWIPSVAINPAHLRSVVEENGGVVTDVAAP
jgi:hypothetical protein